MATTASSLKARAKKFDAGWPVLIISVLVLCVGSTVAKEAHTPGLTLACVRSIIAGLAWQVILAFRKRHITWKGFKAAVLPGVTFGVNIACFFTAVHHIPVAKAEFIGAMGPLVVVPAGALIYRERIPWRALVWGIPALSGVAMVALLSARSKGEANGFGIFMAIASVFTWATYLMLSKKFRPGIDIGEFMACASLAAAVVLLPFSIVKDGFITAIPARGWPWLIFLAFSNGVIAHTLILVAQKHLPLGTISTMQTAQPGLAAGAAWLLLGETVRPVQLLGMALVIGSLICYSLTVQRAAFPWQSRR
jgi:probable blue pigment (indigoidine) exporter